LPGESALPKFMKITNPVFFLFFLQVNFHGFFAQQSLGQGTHKCSYFIPYSHVRDLDIVLLKDKDSLYKRTFPYNSSILKLGKDSTFIYCYISKPSFDISTGKYSREGNIIILNWDSLKTAQIAIEPEVYKQYFMFKRPSPFKAEGVKFVCEKDKLIPVRSYTDFNRIEFLYSSADLYKVNPGTDSLHTITYDLSGDKLIINYGEKTVREIPAKTVWGFAIFQNHAVKVYRRTPKGFNWYGMPGVRIVQLDKLIIYTVGEGPRYSYFSKDLDSEIYALTMPEVKKVFKNDKDFLNKVYREFGSNGAVNGSDDFLNSYKFIEMYRAYAKN